MSAATNHRPDRPIESYPEAELPSLPPEEAPGEATDPAAAPAQAKPLEVAALRFLDPNALSATVTLAFPFEWEGREIRDITIRRLATAEVGAVMETIPEGEDYDVYVFVAVMTGLPAPVLRGLIEDDRAEVAAKARPLLPRPVAEAFSSPTSGPGEATPSPPPEA